MKKILIALGLIILISTFVNLINIKSNFSFKISNESQIGIRSKGGNINLNSSSEKDNVSGYLSHKIFSKPSIELVSNNLILVSEKINGEVYLPNNIKFSDITIVSGAGNANLNLKDSNVSNLSFSAGASNVYLVLPKDTSSKFNFNIGAGNLNLVIPKSGELSGIKIIASSTSNMNLGEAWVKTADGMETKDFKNSKVNSVIDLTKGGSVNLQISSEK